MDVPAGQVELPEASWIMGRSARWYTPEGQALLLEHPDGPIGPVLLRIGLGVLFGFPRLDDLRIALRRSVEGYRHARSRVAVQLAFWRARRLGAAAAATDSGSRTRVR